MDLAAAATTWPRVNQVTSRNDSVAMLLMVVLAQEDRARIGDHFHLCLRDAHLSHGTQRSSLTQGSSSHSVSAARKIFIASPFKG